MGVDRGVARRETVPLPIPRPDRWTSTRFLGSLVPFTRIGEINSSSGRVQGPEHPFGSRRAAAAKAVVEKVPGADKVLGRDATGTKTPPAEYVVAEDLPDAVKECYLSVLVWLVHVEDSHIDERELCEIQILATQLRCNAEVRQVVRSRLEDPQSLDVEAQIALMLERVRSGRSDGTLAVRCSLLKDAIRVWRANSDGSAREKPAIRWLAELLELDDKKVAFIEEACVQDARILAGEVSDSEIKKVAASMAANATGVGVPVAAVYLSGSVTGLSAAGITSGLSALGLGGLLGLSAMVSGIGVAILVGGAAYKGVRWALGDPSGTGHLAES